MGGDCRPFIIDNSLSINIDTIHDFFLAERYEIFFGSTAARTERSARLSEKGIGLLELKLNDSEMDEKFQALAPDVVLFDRFMTEEQFGWKIDENCPRAM